MGPIWGRQDPGGPHVDPMDFVSGYAATERSREGDYFAGCFQPCPQCTLGYYGDWIRLFLFFLCIIEYFIRYTHSFLGLFCYGDIFS